MLCPPDSSYHVAQSCAHTQIRADENDTVRVMEELESLEEDHPGVDGSHPVGQGGSPNGILCALSKVHGPWAFVYWQVSVRGNLCHT